MNKLMEIEIGKLGTTITGKTPSSNNPEDFGTEYMFITPSDSFDDKMIFKTNRYLSEVGINKLKNKVLPPKSVLVSCIGSAMGKIIMNHSSAISNQQINSIIINKNFDSDYIYYNLKNNYKLLRNAAAGSTALPMLNKTDFDKLIINIHKELVDQQKIASVLSALDSKIQLNNRINFELEAMAKTLYDYWFVQFDFPVVTSSGGEKPYKTSGGKMVWNEELKREIPEGWRVERLDKIMRIVRGASPRPIDDFMSSSGMPWIKISDATKANNRFILFTKEFIKEEGASKSRELQPGTLILSNSASPGIPKIVNINACVHDGWLIVDSYKYGFYNEFMFHYFENFRAKILNMGTGSIFKNLKTEYIKELLVAIPSNEILIESEKTFKNLSYQILTNAQQNQKLTELRDWLLPMLMNGQVKVN